MVDSTLRTIAIVVFWVGVALVIAAALRVVLMADSTHGPLYTARDVTLFMRVSGSQIDYAEALDHITQDLPNDSLTFPPDEPVYVLRGSEFPSERSFRGYMRFQAEAREWQPANPDRVKSDRHHEFRLADTEEGKIIDLGGPDGGRYWRITSHHLVGDSDAQAAAVTARATGSVGCTYNDATVERVPDTEEGS